MKNWETGKEVRITKEKGKGTENQFSFFRNSQILTINNKPQTVNAFPP